MTSTRSASIAMIAAALAACGEDPSYIDSRALIEVGIPDSGITTATAQVFLPMRLERPNELMRRADLAALYGVQVPYVKLEDIDVSLEWTVRNLSASDGTARVQMNGGNEWFYYVPLNFVIDPEEDEEPPPLVGDIPLIVPAQGTLSGVFREDQLAEAARDLELITRGATNPFAAMLQPHVDVVSFPDSATGTEIPEQAFAHLVQYDVILEADQHMVLEFVLRVRDHRKILHDQLLDAPPAELTAFAPVAFVPPPPPAALR